MRNRHSLFFLFLFFAAGAFAQTPMTVEQAIEIALKNNYDILMAKNRSEIATINDNIGNAGMLPRANVTMSDNATYNNLNQKYSSGLEVNTKNVTGNTLNPSLNISWTLFDGLKMFATKGRLKKLEEIGVLNYRDTLQTAVSQVINAYYDIVSADQQMKAIKDDIQVSEVRVKLAEAVFNVGNSAKTDLLQAKVDLNASKSVAITQQKLIDQKKAELNRILSRNADTEFDVLDTIAITYEPSLNDINRLDSTNYSLLSAAENIDVLRFAKKEAFSQFLPNLTANGGYQYTRTQSTGGFSLYNQNYGLYGGFTLTVPLFNGLNTINQVKIAGIQVTNAQYAFEKAKIQTKINYYKALKDFEAAKALLKLEEDNIQLADENQRIALERFRLAQSTALELREAQKSYIDAQTRLVTARYGAKTAETELMRLQGVLVK